MKDKKQNPELRISVKAADGKAVKLRLYDATHFGGPFGLYRVKLDREWMRTESEKYLFLTTPAALELAVRSAGLGLQEQLAPAIRHHDRVRVPVRDDETGREWLEKGFASSPPFLGVDGRWRVFVLIFGGFREVLCDEVEKT
ncbi:MAG: hypothetical protein AB7E32_14780 [Desulfovibrio sp.]